MMPLLPPSTHLSSAQVRWLDSTVTDYLKGKGKESYDEKRAIVSELLEFIKTANSAAPNPVAIPADTPSKNSSADNSNDALSQSLSLTRTDKNDSSSIGRTRSKTTRVTLMGSRKIVPMDTQASAALSILTSPEANSFITDFNKDIDFENDKVRQMDNVQQIYSDKEDDIITSGLGLLSGMDMEGAITFKNFKTTFSTTKFLMGFFNSKSGDVYAKSALTLRGNHSLVAARMTNFFHHCKNPAFTRSKEHAAVEESYLEVPNSHSAIYRKHYRFPPPLTDREGINKIVWKRLTDDSIVVIYHPLLSHPKVEAKDGKVMIRALIQITIHVKQLDDATTEVNMGYHMRFGGNAPKALINGFIIPDMNRVAGHHTAYFACSINLDALLEKDGRLLGEVLVNQIKRKRKKGGWKKRAELGKVGVYEFLYISVAMRELLPQYPWFRALLHEISLNQVKVARTVQTALSDLKDDDAINLAKGFSTIILSNTEALAAVDHWISQNVALEELEKEYPWTRSFFVEIAQFNLNTSNFGLKLRVFGGALLSTVDLITEVYMTVKFFNTEGQEGYGRINAWIIGLTILTQMLISYANNSKKLGYFVKDALAVLVGFKPALDAFRVGSGAEQGEDQPMSPIHEMSCCKVAEVVCEAVPSTIIQIYALLLADKRGLDALASILVSALTVGFTSSMLTYDWDTSPSQRTKNPTFYGFVADKSFKRAVCFLSMMSISFAQVLLLTFSCALLAVTNSKFLALFIGLDMGLYFLYKIIKKDFYQQHNVSGIVRFINSLFTRLCGKLMVNFTMMFQLRNPCEVGGFLFMFAVFYSIIGSFVAAHLYSNYYEGTTKLSDETLKNVLVTLSVVWLVSAVSLVSVVKKDYLRTFYSLETISEYKRRCLMSFREDQEDLKSKVLKEHPDVYKAWGEELLKPWTLKNWSRWEEEKPAWFTDRWIECVPNEYIPYDYRVKYKKTKGRVDDENLKRRRGSISVRELVGGQEER
ncbi:hypothetical protein TrST_g12551 [Triparma strigata]|uniref:Uncharacterized protein n=1 Tax=Triparma strigata TaxID=1606541 RepID=A0A9W7B8M7_9STRA|nr:hypothetical protein TrST_g12551 [Triparma strigata]